MKFRALIGFLLMSLMGLSGCDQQDSGDATKASVLEASPTSQPLMPNQSHQTSTVDVKTQSLIADQSTVVSEKETQPTDDIQKADAMQTAIEDEPKVSVKSGKALYANCSACHGEQGQGIVGPKLKGLSEKVVIAKLKAYKAGKKLGPMSSVMIPNAQQLSEDDIKTVAAYIASL